MSIGTGPDETALCERAEQLCVEASNLARVSTHRVASLMP
jgi:hypothetical protein